MRKFLSETINRGTTIILPSLTEVLKIAKSNKYISSGWKNNISLEECYEAIEKGNPALKDEVEEEIHLVEEVVDEITPSFSMSTEGFKRTDDSDMVSPELAASGETDFCLKPKDNPFEVKEGKGGGAYRLLINTDVSWWGAEKDNSVLVGGLVHILHRYGPVEIWIQQGWLGEHKTDGVTLFKLEYPASFDVTAFSFWISHSGKDVPFSWHINRTLGRISSRTSYTAEIDCDVMLRGDWMRTIGLTNYTFRQMTYTERRKKMAEWISKSALCVVGGTSGNDEFDGEQRKFN